MSRFLCDLATTDEQREAVSILGDYSIFTLLDLTHAMAEKRLRTILNDDQCLVVLELAWSVICSDQGLPPVKFPRSSEPTT